MFGFILNNAFGIAVNDSFVILRNSLINIFKIYYAIWIKYEIINMYENVLQSSQPDPLPKIFPNDQTTDIFMGEGWTWLDREFSPLYRII